MSALEKIQEKSILEMDDIEYCIHQTAVLNPHNEDNATIAATKYAALQARVAELEKQLKVAVHLSPSDSKESFDWVVLGRISDLEALLYEFQNNPNIELGELGHKKIDDILGAA